jgi:hypothetical protein
LTPLADEIRRIYHVTPKTIAIAPSPLPRPAAKNRGRQDGSIRRKGDGCRGKQRASADEVWHQADCMESA